MMYTVCEQNQGMMTVLCISKVLLRYPGQTKDSPQAEENVQSLELPKRLRRFTSHGSYKYIHHMDYIGWSQDGVFTKLLCSADYNFCQGAERPRLVAQTHYWRVAPALAILLFEQYVCCSL